MAELLKVAGITLTSAGESTLRAFQAFIMAPAKVAAGGDSREYVMILDVDLSCKGRRLQKNHKSPPPCVPALPLEGKGCCG